MSDGIYRDKNGNGYFLDAQKRIHLIPAHSNDDRVIGTIHVEKDGLTYYIKREDESQIFRKTNAWSINDEILKRVDVIKYVTLNTVYTISKEDAVSKGQYFHFKNSTELKIYVPINYWTQNAPT